ncbi:phage tail tape measure protein [Providencia sp. PROV266]|uniref:phage tail tape measure protein n=1 Tax=Providencia sp. PROV266 TaxID=2949954 RepID=UPI00234A97DE|nr:phage tail tape measure protein [Providencia sp. PROV266]
MAEQTSRLAIILDSTKAKQNSDTLASSLERLTAQGEKATDSADGLSFSFKRLASTAAGAMSIASVIKIADDWGQIGARMKNTLKSVEGDIKSYADIQERLLVISNRNGKNIEDSQLLYIGAATSMQELGYNTAQTIDYIESLSSSMTANASSANEVLSMQNALNKSMVAGKVAGENWNSIMNATPTLLGDIAKELERQSGGIKVTEMEVKKLASEGKISFKLFADAVMAAKDANNALADSMDNTVADGFTRVTNSIKAYYGEMNQSLGITRSLSAGLATVSDNFGEVATTLTALVGIGAARYVGNLSTSIYDNTRKLADNAIANRKLAVDKVNTARATLIQAQNEKAAALAAVESTKAQQAAATTEIQRISLKTQLANQTAVLTAATKAETTATNELTLATGRANIASNLLKGTISLLGGPVGFAMLAAGGMYSFASSMQQAKDDAIALSRGLDGLVNKLKEMTREQKLIKIGEIEESFTALESAARKAQIAFTDGGFRRALNKSKRALDEAKVGTKEYADALNEFESASKNYEVALAKKTQAENDLSRAQNTVKVMQADLNGTLQQGTDLLKRNQSILPDFGAAWKGVGIDIGAAANALGKFNSESLLVKYSTPETASFFKSLDRQLELSNKSAKDRFITNAGFSAKDAGASPDEIALAKQIAAQIYDQSEAQRELGRSTTQTESAAQKLLETLKEQQIALLLQKELGKDIGSQEQAKAAFLDKIKRMEEDQAKGKLTADQKSLLANKELIQAEYDRNIQLEQYIKNKELEVKIAAFHKQIAEESILVQEQYNQTLAMAGKGNLEQGRLQARFQVQNEFQRKQADLQKQFQDKSTGMTEGMYKKETQFISDELQKRLAMLEDYHGKQDVMRGNWTLGIDTALQNYMDNARNNSQQAEGFITNSLQNITEGSADALTDLVTNSKNAFDAIGDFFGDLSKSIIKDLIRIAIQAQITNAITGLFGGIAGGSGAAAGAGASTSGTGAMGMSTSWRAYSSGGYTGRGGKYDPAGIVHKDEFVFNKEATNSIGKENLYDLMNTGEMPNYQLSPDAYAMKYLHPANQTNNTTNNSNVNNNSETNESEQSTIVVQQTITVNVSGNGDKALVQMLRQAVTEGANQGAKKAVAEIQRDFATNGQTRKLLER